MASVIDMVARCMQRQDPAIPIACFAETTGSGEIVRCSTESLPPSDHGITGALDTVTHTEPVAYG